MGMKHTTFILGAGSSEPYKYPIGEKLKYIIINNLNPNSKTYNELLDFNYNKDLLNLFKNELTNCGRYSIDAFLSNRREFEDIGKTAIAQALIPFENKLNLFPEDNPLSKDLYKFIFNIISKTKDDIINCGLNIITFNYDRSFEFYINNALCSSFKLNPYQSYDFQKNIETIHVYGKLCNLPFEGNKSRPYVPTYDLDDLALARDQINVIHVGDEAIANNISRSIKVLDNTHYLYILGFGYDELNLNRLKLNNYIFERIIGTTMGLLEPKKKFVLSYFGHHGYFYDNDVYDLMVNNYPIIEN